MVLVGRPFCVRGRPLRAAAFTFPAERATALLFKRRFTRVSPGLLYQDSNVCAPHITDCFAAAYTSLSCTRYAIFFSITFNSINNIVSIYFPINYIFVFFTLVRQFYT